MILFLKWFLSHVHLLRFYKWIMPGFLSVKIKPQQTYYGVLNDGWRKVWVNLFTDSLCLPMEASMLAVALWESGNHKAASLVGANITKGWEMAANVCPASKIQNLSSNEIPSKVLTFLKKFPIPFSHADIRICNGKNVASSENVKDVCSIVQYILR